MIAAHGKRGKDEHANRRLVLFSFSKPTVHKTALAFHLFLAGASNGKQGKDRHAPAAEPFSD
jgi:hypothetical protein